MLKKSLSRMLSRLGACIACITGRMTWSSPPWATYLGSKARTKPWHFWGTIVGTLVVIGLAYYGYCVYKNMPEPIYVTAHITSPQPMPADGIPDLVGIDFGTTGPTFDAKSVAPLKMVGTQVTKGVTMTPTLPGTWKWESDNRLIFTPTQPWLAGQTYTVSFEKDFFVKHAKFEKYTYTFTTQPIQASIEKLEFYQDPVDPKIRQVVATINFNYPIDTTSFEKNTALILQAVKDDKLDLAAQRIKYNVTYDQYKRIAYLKSEILQLPEVPRFLELVIAKGVATTQGPSTTQESAQQDVKIPDSSDYLTVAQTQASIIRDEQDRPDQVLTVETTLGVQQAELTKNLQVYLLPQAYPATSTEEAKPNYVWENPGEVTADILKLATPLETQAMPADRDYATLHSFKFKTQPPRYIYLKINKGMIGFGGFHLAKDYEAVIKVPEYPKEIRFLHQGALLALNDEQKLSVIIRGVPAVKFQIARVLSEDINHLITQTQGKFDDPRFSNYNFNQQNISDIKSEIRQFDVTDLAKPQYTALNLQQYLAPNGTTPTSGQGPRGLFLLQATSWDVANNTALDVKTSRMVLITDLGLIVKDNSDGSHEVFVQSITNGTPAAGVAVTIMGKNGLPILVRNTDAQGHVIFPNLKDFVDEREPVVYLARMGEDISFIPYNKDDRQLNYSRFDVGGISNNQDTSTLTAYLFSDRGLYRPGDTAHIGMIIKQAFVNPQAPGLTLQATIYDPKGTTVRDQKFTLDASGYMTLDFPTDATSPTGKYSIDLYIVRDNQSSSLLGSTSIRVAEFQPDRLRIKAKLSQQSPGWITPEGLNVKVDLVNLYGAPASERKISSRLILAPKPVQFSQFPDFTFFDPLIDPNKPPKVFNDNLPDTKTNAQGQADIALDLNRFEKATYQLTVFTEGFEAEGGRSVTTQATALVSPLPYIIGYKADGDLSYIQQNGARSVNFIAINPQLQQIPLNDLKIQLSSVHPVTTLVKDPDGTYKYQSIVQTNVVSTNAFTVDVKGNNYVLPSQQIGDFTIAILDKNNTTLSQFKFSVVGNSQQPLGKNAELSVKLNKTEYQAGEDIEMQITSPYTGAGLITIERDKVYTSTWFKTDATSSVQKVTIPSDFVGNGYVNIAFVRDWNSPDIFMSPLSYNIVPFSVSHENRTIHIDLNTPTLARPGEPFTIGYKTDVPSKIIVFAVDEGILQAANYQTPDPLGFFFQKHALEVITQQTVDQILPKYIQTRELSAIGGDGGEEDVTNNLNPFKRKTDAPVVYWSGIIDADTTEHQLVYQIPDYFNGSLRVMAVAVATDKVGATEKTSQVRGDFVINPNIPTFVAPGDEFNISASVANNVEGSGKDAKTTVQISASPQLEVIGAASQTLAIPENQEKAVQFKLRAKSSLGAAEIVLTANGSNKTSKMTTGLSVRPASAFFTSIASGYSKDATKTLKVDRILYPEYRQVEAAISSSPLILVVGLQRYLENFPYGCTEQLTSKALPLLAMAKQPWFSNDPAAITSKMQATIQAIGQRQMSSGAFSYWPDAEDNSNNTFATVYAMHFLTEAKAQGYPVPQTLFDNGIAYLKDFAAQNVTNMDEARNQAYAIYLLTRNEMVTTNFVTNLQVYLDQNQTDNWKNDITSAYIAATYQLLKNSADANRLIKLYQPQTQVTELTSDFYNTQIADAQYLYLLAHEFPTLLPQLGNKLVPALVTALNSDSINTVLSGYASLALGAYGQAQPNTTNSTFNVIEIFNNGQQKSLNSPLRNYQKVAIDDLVKQVNLGNPDQLNYFYQFVQAGFDKNLPTTPLKQGIEIYREYHDLQGKVITQTKLGNDIEVHIKLRALNDAELSNIVVVDLLPGGFEVVLDSIKTEDMDYIDAREDRVILFGSASGTSKEIVYRIKATNPGRYTVPAITAGSMYDPNIRARDLGGVMNVSN